jgi:hypothetical protein
MTSKEELKSQIRAAFTDASYPGDNHLVDVPKDDEAFQVRLAFYGKNDWNILTPDFFDGAPLGLGTALHFFSDAAFRFYLPAYMLADIDGKLERSDPVLHLTHAFDTKSRHERINPKGPDQTTWRDYASARFATFTQPEAAAIVAYLEFKSSADTLRRGRIDEALLEYWYERAT